MPKVDTRRKVKNPKTGRMVYATGTLGKAIREKKKKQEARKKTIAKKVAKKPTKTAAKPKKTLKKKTGGPVKGKWYGERGVTKVKSPVEKKRPKKVAKSYDYRPSARAFFDMGLTGPVCYGGKCHTMAFRNNGSPYWKAM